MYGTLKLSLASMRHHVCFCCLFLFVCSTPVSAQQNLTIELNKLESVENACRAYMIFENNSGTSYDSLKLDLVMFDADGLINKRIAVEGAPLPVGKTSVKLFDIQDVSCEQLGRILLNDVLSCSGPAGEYSDCLARIETTSRNLVSFFK